MPDKINPVGDGSIAVRFRDSGDKSHRGMVTVASPTSDDVLVSVGDGSIAVRMRKMVDGSYAEVISVHGMDGRGNEGALKLFGAVLNNLSFNQTTGLSPDANAGYGMKGEAEGHFDAMCLVWVNRAGNALLNCSALVAVTDTAAIDTPAHVGQPNISAVNGGADNTQYGQLAPAGSILGWRPATVSGQTSFTVPAGVTAPAYVQTDWIPLSSLKYRTDGGTRPLWMFRTQHNGTADGGFSFLAGAGIAQLRTAIAAARGRILQFIYAGLGVSNPAAAGNLTSSNIEVFPMFRYRTTVVNVMITTDSIGQNDGFVSAVYTNWCMRACYDVSTIERPVIPNNMGCSGKTSTEYWARSREIMDQLTTIPDIWMVSPASVNDLYLNLDRLFEGHRARAFEMLAYAKKKGIKPSNIIWIPLMPYNSNNALQDSYRLGFNAFLKTLPGQVLNFSALGDGATPEKWAGAYGRLGTSKGVVTISQASPAVVTLTGHALAANTPVELTTTLGLPAGIPVGSRLFVKTVLDANTFTLSAELNGPALNATSASAAGAVHTLWITQDSFHPNENGVETIMTPEAVRCLRNLV